MYDIVTVSNATEEVLLLGKLCYYVMLKQRNVCVLLQMSNIR